MLRQVKRDVITYRNEARAQKAPGLACLINVLVAEQSAEDRLGGDAAEDHERTK